jgi:hypothetical protein
MKVKNKSPFYICLGFLMLLPACMPCMHKSHLIKKRLYIRQAQTIAAPEREQCERVPPTLTVWIHGTKFGEDALFKKVFCAKPGLKHVNELPPYHSLTLRMKALADHCAEFFPYESVYCFCWSGKLNTCERELSAEKLHQTLCSLIETYKAQYQETPKIRLVCHSHGANVALHLARINARKEQKIVIDSLILFACPVQCDTRECVFDCMFKRIYSLYSPLDWVQILAPQWACRVRNRDGKVVLCKNQWLPLSQRRFPHAPSLRQAWVKRDDQALSHADFTSKKFLRLLPEMLDTMDEAYTECSDLNGGKKLLLHIKTCY